MPSIGRTLNCSKIIQASGSESQEEGGYLQALLPKRILGEFTVFGKILLLFYQKRRLRVHASEFFGHIFRLLHLAGVRTQSKNAIEFPKSQMEARKNYLYLFRKYTIYRAARLSFCFFYLGKKQTYTGNKDKANIKIYHLYKYFIFSNKFSSKRILIIFQTYDSLLIKKWTNQ